MSLQPLTRRTRIDAEARPFCSSPSYAKLDYVEQPMLSKEDWRKGEGQAEYRAKDTARRQSALAGGRSASGWVGRRLTWAKQHWKMLVIALLSSVIALALL